MQVHFIQGYIEPDVSFPFSQDFQGRIAKEVTSLIKPSAKFNKKYGPDFDLLFYMSAKRALLDNEIQGPGVHKKTKDVEYSIFLPYKVIMRYPDAPRFALMFLLKGVCHVFELLDIDTHKLSEKRDSIIEGICADPTMLRDPDGDEAPEEIRVRRVFTSFFENNCQVGNKRASRK